MEHSDDAKQDGRVLDMFIAGATHRQIAERLEIAEEVVDAAVRREIDRGAKRRELLCQEAPAVLVERQESLFRAHYPAALRGDHRSADICQRLLTAQSSQSRANTDPSVAGVAATAEDETTTLIALRDRLAREIDTCGSPRDLAALSRQYVDVVDRLSLNKSPEKSKVDEIAQRRASRRATSR